MIELFTSWTTGKRGPARNLRGQKCRLVSTAKSLTLPVHVAAKRGHEVVIQLLLAVGADVNAKDSNSVTALHEAAEKGHEAVIKLLLAVGASF
jgi:ankyrin repeat protein